jgi:hypothetical protein
MAAMGVGAALLGAGIAVGTRAVPMPLADSYAGQAPRAATLTTTPVMSQPGASAFGYAVASVPASLAARTPKSSPTPTPTPTHRRSATAEPTPSMTRASTPSTTRASTPAQAPSTAASSRPPTPGSTLTPQPTAEYQTPTGQNQKAWSEAILTALGDPLTSANIVSIGYWMQNEAGTAPYGIVGANNPINVSEPGYGGTQIQYEAPGYYLMSYPTVAGGVAATAAYLNNGSYPQILSDLKQGAGLSDPALAGEQQEYSGNGYSTIPDSWGQSQGMPES